MLQTVHILTAVRRLHELLLEVKIDLDKLRDDVCGVRAEMQEMREEWSWETASESETESDVSQQSAPASISF